MMLLAVRDMGPYLTWLGVLIAAVVVAGVLLLIFRASVLGKGKGATEAGLMENLRSMRDRGEISPEEFDSARSAMAARMAGASAAQPGTALKKKRSPQGGDRVAPPGFDLTGRPLPAKPDEGRAPPGNAG
jgi:hypothetical protein